MPFQSWVECLIQACVACVNMHTRLQNCDIFNFFYKRIGKTCLQGYNSDQFFPPFLSDMAIKRDPIKKSNINRQSYTFSFFPHKSIGITCNVIVLAIFSRPILVKLIQQFTKETCASMLLTDKEIQCELSPQWYFALCTSLSIPICKQ